MDIHIVLPAVSEDQVGDGLRELTRILIEDGHADDDGGGFLGGRYGYGVHFENDVFEMHPYYWDDCECGHAEADTEWYRTHTHAASCYQQVIRARGFLDYDTETDLSSRERSEHNRTIADVACAEMGLDPVTGCYVHCTCTFDPDYRAWQEANPHDSRCGVVLPNFRHKTTGSTVSFYKYIGRGMKVALTTGWQEVLADCVASLHAPAAPEASADTTGPAR